MPDIPAIVVTKPNALGEVATEGYTIHWTADDPDSNATISLYYDTDNSDLNGTPISGASNISEDNDPDLFTWNTTNVTPNYYYIYARIDDGVNPPQYSYSTGTVKVESANNQPVDPNNWRQVEYVPGTNYQGIGYGDGTYIAVGKRAAISLSGNEALSWGHHSSTPITDDMDFYDAHHHSGRWILVGEDNVGGVIIHSDHIDPSGSHYQWVIPNQWYGESVRDIHYADGKWVAVGHPNLVLYSTNNGNTWNQGTIIGSSFNFDFQAVTYDASNDTWIAVSESSFNRSQIATSNDGITWHQRDFFNNTYRLQGVASHGGQATAVGYKTTSGDKEVILTSSNGGVSWTDASAGSQALFDVVHRPDGWVAVGNDSIATSDDGSLWQRAPSNLGYSMNAVVYAPDEKNLVAVLHSRIYRARTVGSSLHHLIEIQVFGSGTVAGAGFSNCSDYCVDSWPEGSVLPLTAEPASGWLLTSWGGSCEGTAGHRCDLILTQSESIDVVFELDDPPTITLLEPDGTFDKAHQTYTITWTDNDPDSSANIRLYYDLDSDGANGTEITQGAILEDDESDRYFFDTSSLPENDYYIYAVINDGTNPPVTSVSSGPITVIHNAPPRLTIQEPNGIGDTADLSYTLRWTDEDGDNDASIDFFYDTDDSGADGTPVPGAQNLSENDETDQFVWDITGLPERDFYVYATISDGVMDPYTVYSPGPLTVLHVSTNVPPTLSFVEPDGVNDTADQSYDIVWTDEDPDNNASIYLFYDTDNAGADGEPINSVAISEDDETDRITWDSSSLPNGDYYVYAVINDNVRPPVTVYSNGSVTISHANAVPSLTLHEPDGVNDSADQSFTLTWTDADPDDDASISLYYDVDNTGADGTLIVDNLSEDDETDSYTWSTAGLNGGDYYVYAVIDDGSHTPLTVYSTGQVSVDHEGYGIAWARQAGSTGRDRAYAIAADSAGNSYVTGYLKGDIQFGSILLTQSDAREAFLVKYDPNGNALWAFNFGVQDDSYGEAVAVDASGNVYVAGYFENLMRFGSTTLTAVGSTDVYVAKYTSGGSLVWVKQFGTGGWSQILDLAVAGNGDVYITGEFTDQIAFGGTTLTSSGRDDVFVTKLNSSGQAQWARKGGSTSDDKGFGIAVDGSGNAFVIGQYEQTAVFNGLSVTATDHNPDIFFVKYSSSGAIQWLKSFGGEGWNRGKAVAVDGSSVYLTGLFAEDANFGGFNLSATTSPEVFIVKCSASTGAVQWAKSGGGALDDRAHAITVTPDHDVVVAGHYWGRAQFGDVTLGTGVGFVAQYSSSGNLEWARPLPDRAYGVAADGAGDLLVAGYLTGTASFDRTTFTSVGDSDVYVAKIDRATVSNTPPVIDIVEPDGANDIVAESFTITWTDDDADDDAQILLFYDTNASGEDGTLLTPIALSEDDDTSDQHVWDVSTLAPGDYYVYAQIQDNSNPTVTVYSDGPVTVDPSGGNVAPVLSFLEPDGTSDLASQSYLVTWSAQDPDSTATIDLFYDVDTVVGGELPIASGLAENDGAGSHTWNLSGVADGQYYVYGVIDDGVAPPVGVYSSGRVTVDSIPPRVSGVSSVQDTGDGQLVEGELTSANVWQLLVTFDEGMWDPAGNNNPGDVTNPASYRVSLETGSGFDPAGCASPETPDDVPVVVSYAAASRTAALSLQGGGLADGTYRLLVCGAVLDAAGNSLDGDGDGAAGDDFARTFSVDATPPRVSSVGSTPDTGDGVLGEGEATRLSLTELHVKLDEAVYDPPGDNELDDVTNTLNHVLMSDGGDGFDTVDCATGGDIGDLGIGIDSVSYEPATQTVTLLVNKGSPLAEGRYRLFVCGTTSIVDLAGNVLDGDGDGLGGDDFVRTFVIDQSEPANPSVSSPAHPPGVWTAQPTVSVEWSGALDSGDSGVEGYSVAFDLAPTTLPDTTIDVAHALDPHTTSSGLLANGTHYFHLRTCDGAGNCAPAVHLGPFLIDAAAPSPATGLSSSSHPVGEPVNDTTIDVSWSPATDADSGIAGYASVFDPASSWTCDQSQDLPASASTATSPELPSGSWYFHLCAVDQAGNWSGVATAGPFEVASVDVRPEVSAPGVATLGMAFNAEVTVLNDGPSIATGVNLTLGGTLDVLSPTVIDLGSLAPGASTTVDVSLIGQSLGVATLEATVTAAEDDPVTNNTSVASILVNRDGLAGYWPFDEGSGETAVDATGRGNDGTIVGAVHTAGVRGGALDFNGDSKLVRLPGDMTSYVEDHFTVSLWMKVTSVKSLNYLFHDRDDRPGIRLLGDNRPMFSFRPNGTADPQPIGVARDYRLSLPVGEWIHVAARWDGTTYSGYVDGHLIEAVELPYFQFGNRLQVGSDGGPTRSFDGLIDEVRIYNRALGDAELRSLATELVGHWRLDEASGDVTFDSSGRRNHGLLMNDSGNVWQRTEGAIRGGVDLDGTNYVAIPDDGTLSIAGSMTVEAWVQVRTSPARFVHKTASFSNNEDNYTLGTNEFGEFLFRFENSVDGGDWSITSTTSAQPGAWHHVAGTYDGQDLRIYVDGVLEKTRTIGPVIPYTGPADLIFGTTQFTTHAQRFWMDGLIDEVRIYRRALSAEEIALHAVATVGWWRFEEPEGARVFDSSGNFHDGDLSTVTGTPWQRVAGAVGQGLDFMDGENQVRIPDDGSFSLTRPFTVECWVKARQPFARAIVKTAQEGANQDNYSLVTSETGLYRFHMERSSDGEDLGATATTMACTTRFHHVAGTFDGEALHVYVDGVLEATNTAGPFTPHVGSYDLLLGTNSHPGRNNVHWTDGVLDEVAIHARPLSAAKIAARAAAGPVHPAPSGEMTQPTGTVRGTVTVEAAASDVDGLAEVYVTFVDGGAPLALCGVSAPSACVGDSGAWTVADVDPQAHGVTAAGTLTLKLFVRDECGDDLVQVASSNVSWAPNNRAPILDPIGGFTVDAGALLSFTATASDPDGHGLAFSLSNAPSGAVIDPQSGVFTWTPTSAQGPQTYSFDVVVTDDDPTGPLSDSETIEITVEIPDNDPPTVVRVDTVAGTGGGALTACETARVAVTEVQLTFSEALLNPPGDVDPDDVTNPDNYLLLAAGPDQDFGTDLCGTLFGDDQPVSLDSVSWDEASLTARLTLAGGVSLGDASHRLIACGSTSLYDLAGHPLDGNGDGAGGDDFLMDFRVDVDNVFDNGHLDCGLAPWIPTSTNAAEVVYSSEDIDGSSVSGSVHVSNLTSSTTFTVSQCVQVEAGSPHQLTAKIRFGASAGVSGSLLGACVYFDEAACVGDPLAGTYEQALQIEDTGGQWVGFEGTWTSPDQSASAMCTIGVLIPGGEGFDAHLDHLYLRSHELIFSDGFESGNTSVWSHLQ